ncbi:acyl-CoA dehydrogenase family protein [Halostreptopolyspora alba]|uniref:Acyl-CoA dehydrogenase n=1 Tax=Halostreptopolyspora alba TaxID=2487137 RepID=A0A3N0EFD1_9ACTN|nr:acyl-CoA dehydrogenase [Nocardiopsaceae bacterium YIM 96095]
MRLVLDSEQRQLRSTVRELLADHAPPTRVREVMDGGDGYDPALWRRVSAELGLAGLVVSESRGGSGAGHVERCVVLEELGRALAPVPYLASAALAVDTVLALEDATLEQRLLAGLASGERIGAVAPAGDDGDWGSATASLTAGWRDGGWVLDGHVSFVVSGDVADTVLAYATAPEGPAWFAVSGDAAGLGRTRLRTLDPTRPMARLEFASTPAHRADGADPAAVLEAVRDRAAVALTAERVGMMSRVLEMTVDYTKSRVQFGRPVGSYQAVKHGCADMYCAYQQAESVLRYAAWAADHAPAELPLAAALAQAHTGPASFRVAADAVQLHGGVGYTWEHDAHLYYKRAKTSELLLGAADQQRERLAERLGV